MAAFPPVKLVVRNDPKTGEFHYKFFGDWNTKKIARVIVGHLEREYKHYQSLRVRGLIPEGGLPLDGKALPPEPEMVGKQGKVWERTCLQCSQRFVTRSPNGRYCKTCRSNRRIRKSLVVEEAAKREVVDAAVVNTSATT